MFRRQAMLGTAVSPAPTPTSAPPPDIEAWAEQYVRSADLSLKLAPPAPPKVFREAPTSLRITEPGRPPELRAARRGERTPKQEALESPHYRARTLHAFWHHELQA